MAVCLNRYSPSYGIEALGHETVHNPVYDERKTINSSFCARDRFPEDDLCISYGDIVYDRSVVEALRNCDAPLCVVIDSEWQRLLELRFDDPLSDAETLWIEDDRVIEIGAEPSGYDEIDGQYIGLIKVRRDYVDEFVDAYDSLDQSSIHMTRFIQHLIDTGWQVAPVEIDGGWLEVDTLEDLEVYRRPSETGQHSKHLSVL